MCKKFVLNEGFIIEQLLLRQRWGFLDFCTELRMCLEALFFATFCFILYFLNDFHDSYLCYITDSDPLSLYTCGDTCLGPYIHMSMQLQNICQNLFLTFGRNIHVPKQYVASVATANSMQLKRLSSFSGRLYRLKLTDWWQTRWESIHLCWTLHNAAVTPSIPRFSLHAWWQSLHMVAR